MSATPGTPPHQRRPHVTFGVLSLVAAGFTGILSLSQGGDAEGRVQHESVASIQSVMTARQPRDTAGYGSVSLSIPI